MCHLVPGWTMQLQKQLCLEEKSCLQVCLPLSSGRGGASGKNGYLCVKVKEKVSICKKTDVIMGTF